MVKKDIRMREKNEVGQYDILHPETNTGQVYDFANEKLLIDIIGILSTLDTSQKTNLVAAINSLKLENISQDNEISSIKTAAINHENNTELHPTQTEKDFWNNKYTKPSTGIPESDLNADTNAFLTEGRAHALNDTIHTTSAEKETWNNKYTKPSTGIPITDLVPDAQSVLMRKIFISSNNPTGGSDGDIWLKYE